MSESSLTPVRVGIIGLGVGAQHAESYSTIKGCEIVAVCDLNVELAVQVAKRHDIPEHYRDWRRITDHPDIDAISICSYDDGHVEQAIRAFDGGKHCFIEKPVALSRVDAEQLLRSQQDSKRWISSNLILRMSPRFKEIRRMVQAGEFGKIFYVEGDYIHDILWKITDGWRGRMEDYCVIYGGGIHLIDLMRWILDEEVVEVCGMSNQILTCSSKYPRDDTFINLLRFESGILAKTTTTLGPQRTKFHALSVYGTERTFINDIPHGKLFTGDQAADETTMTVPYPGVAKGDLLPNFVAAIREKREPAVSARDVFRVMDVCFAARHSVELQRTIPVSYLL